MWLRGRSCVRKQILINLKQIWTASLIACKCSAFDVVNDAKRRRTCVRQATSRRDDILLTVGRDLRQHLDGTNQTLKVGHANQSGVTLSGASKVLTNQICDANGKNCKNVSQLYTGGTPWNGTITIKQGTTTIWSFNLNDSTSQTFTLSSWGTTPWNGKIVIKQGGNVKWSFSLNQSSDNTIELDAWWGWWDSLRNAGTLKYWSANKQTTVNYITPKDSREIYLIQSRPNIYFWDGEQNSKLRFLNYWTNRYVTVAAEIRPNWATFWLVDSAIQTNLAWVSVAWYLIVWNSWQNYISIYSTWATSSSGRHYEIMASKELAVWTYSGAYIYFKNYDNGIDYKQYRIWINNRKPQATLDVAWSIRINTEGNTCAPSSCSEDSVWTIIYRNNKFYWCMKKGTSTSPTYKRYEFTMATNPSELSWSSSCATTSPIQDDSNIK